MFLFIATTPVSDFAALVDNAYKHGILARVTVLTYGQFEP
jgi:hypothetical protein